MDVFKDMPLNLAHLNERKALNCLDCCDWDGATNHYQLASEFILEAMKTTSATKSLQSLQLQHDAYVHHAEVTVKVRKKESETSQVPCFFEKTPVSDDFVEVKSNGIIQQHKEKIYLKKKNRFIARDEREPDSILQFLNVPNEDKPVVRLKKYPKGDHDVIEELKIQNESLKETIKNLVESQEKLKQENQYLKEANATLQYKFKILTKQSSEDKLTSEINAIPHFVVDEEVELTSIMQDPCFFRFDDQVMKHELISAMEEITVSDTLESSIEEKQATGGNNKQVDLEENIQSLRYEEVEET